MTMTTPAPARPPATPGADGPLQPWVYVRGLSKTFGPARVLRDVDFTARAGEIHGLVGQNGSGKSTLIKVLSGVYPADAGSVVEIDGTRLANPVRPRELREHGLAFVHQDLGLVDELTVLENIRLGQFAVHRMSRRIDWRAERDAAQATLLRLHSDIDPSRLVSTLHPGEKAIVAIGRALQNLLPGAGCVVFDESTRALPRDLLPDFYATVQRLAATGTAIILVSHRLDEVLSLTDRVTVLQDGRVVAGDQVTSALTEASLARLLLGREIEMLEDRAPSAPTDRPRAATVLKARDLHGEFLHGVDLDLAPGEVLGVTGSASSGHAELPYVLGGVTPKARGTVEAVNRTFRLPAQPGQLIAAGVVLVPEDRAEEGLAVELSAQDNLTLPRARGRGRLMLRSGWQADEFGEAVAMLGIVPARRDLPCSSFSGGNQQKILLAKWLLNRPEVLLLNEPTQAVDVGARIDILRAIRAAADRGVGVVIASIEAQDLAAVCDRVLVFRDGVVAAELTTDLNAHDITAATYPAPVSAG